jgi:glycine betaine/proline transport system substrate-binding protein
MNIGGYKMKRTLLIVLLCIMAFTISVPASLAQPKTVVFADLSWDSIQFHNRVMAFMLEKGWGYKPDYLFSETMPGYLGLERGDIDIVMEIWTDAQQEWWDRVRKSGKVIDCGKVTPNAASGLYVPRFIIEGDPERNIEPVAPDLKSVFDLKKYYSIFKNPEDPKKGRLYNAPTGWSAHSINKDKLKAYGLEEVIDPFDTGSGTALATAIKGHYIKGEPVLAYYWAPTPLLGELDMVMLEEPPHDPEIWERNHGCASPAYTLAKGVNAAWIDENQEIMGLLENYNTSLDKVNETLAWMKQNDNSAEKAAIWFLKNNPEEWKSWIPEGSGHAAEKIQDALDKAESK